MVWMGTCFAKLDNFIEYVVTAKGVQIRNPFWDPELKGFMRL